MSNEDQPSPEKAHDQSSVLKICMSPLSISGIVGPVPQCKPLLPSKQFYTLDPLPPEAGTATRVSRLIERFRSADPGTLANFSVDPGIHDEDAARLVEAIWPEPSAVRLRALQALANVGLKRLAERAIFPCGPLLENVLPFCQDADRAVALAARSVVLTFLPLNGNAPLSQEVQAGVEVAQKVVREELQLTARLREQASAEPIGTGQTCSSNSHCGNTETREEMVRRMGPNDYRMRERLRDAIRKDTGV